MRDEADDGLFARLLWFWPEAIPFQLRPDGELVIGVRRSPPDSG